MARQVALDSYTYERLVALSGQLTSITKRNITLGMTVSCAISLLETILNTPALGEPFRDRLRSMGFKSPNEFIDVWKWIATKASEKKGLEPRE